MTQVHTLEKSVPTGMTCHLAMRYNHCARRSCSFLCRASVTLNSTTLSNYSYEVSSWVDMVTRGLVNKGYDEKLSEKKMTGYSEHFFIQFFNCWINSSSSERKESKFKFCQYLQKRHPLSTYANMRNMRYHCSGKAEGDAQLCRTIPCVCPE